MHQKNHFLIFFDKKTAHWMTKIVILYRIVCMGGIRQYRYTGKRTP